MESTRVGTVGVVEIHLKRNIQVAGAVADAVAQLPTSDPWVLVAYNTQSEQWQNAQTFDSFEAADEAFVNRCQNQGLDNAARMGVGASGGAGGRVQE